MMELGATICLPRSPHCHDCPLHSQCLAYNSGQVERFPELPERVAATKRLFVAIVCNHRGKLLVRARPPGQVNAGLWEFPNSEAKPSAREKALLPELLPGTEAKTLCTIDHSITRYRMKLKGYAAEIANSKVARDLAALHGAQWLSRTQIAPLAFTSAHGKLREAALAAFGL
jgi:A/G-specific adenine glycosylase